MGFAEAGSRSGIARTIVRAVENAHRATSEEGPLVMMNAAWRWLRDPIRVPNAGKPPAVNEANYSKRGVGSGSEIRQMLMTERVQRRPKGWYSPLLLNAGFGNGSQAINGREFMGDLATGLKAVVENSSTMITWTLAVGAGSVALIMGTSYLRPRQLWARLVYLLFPVGWGFFAVSIYHGNAIARDGVAAQLAHSEKILPQIGADMNTEYISQQNTMEWGMGIFALWLLLYLIWWIVVKDLPRTETKD